MDENDGNDAGESGMSKPTPGPWEIYRDSGLNIFISQPSSVANRTPGYYAEVRRFTSDVSQVEANARLIASSPDLLAALQACDEAMEYMSEYDIPIMLPAQVKAAIKKATGEE